MRSFRITLALVVGFALTASAASTAFRRLTPTSEYFAQRENRKLTKDAAAQVKWLFFEDFEAPLYQPGAHFDPWKGIPDRFIRYSLAWSSYALANVALIDPSQQKLAAHGIDFAIQKIRQKRVWHDWQEDGFGNGDVEKATLEDAVAHGNIMFKGHLNMMYALFQLVSGDNRYEEENTKLTKNIVSELEKNPYAGIVCEPDNWFPQCNSNGYVSLALYDRIHGTDYAERFVKPWVAFMEKNLVDPKTGTLYLSYHPSLHTAKQFVSAYTTAWTLALVHGLDPAFAEKHYPQFKETFLRVSKDGKKAFVRETDDTDDKDSLAMCQALLLAKEMGDHETFDRIMNTLEEEGQPKLVNGQLVYQNKTNPFLAEMMLWAKVHVGTKELIQADWPGAKKTEASIR